MSSTSRKTSLKVLIVDDEKLMSDLFQLLLQARNCVSKVFNCSNSALKHFTQYPDDYDFILSDINMPALQGDKMAEAMLKINPQVNIVLCSEANVDEQKLQAMGIRYFLQKPIKSHDLSFIIDQFRPC